MLVPPTNVLRSPGLLFCAFVAMSTYTSVRFTVWTDTSQQLQLANYEGSWVLDFTLRGMHT